MGSKDSDDRTESGRGRGPLPDDRRPSCVQQGWIDVYKVDRGGGGARIKYHAKDGKDAKGKTIKVKLTGIALKVGKPYRGGRIHVRVSPAGKVMTLRITKDSDKPGFTGTKGDENWDYYVQGTANDTVKQTKDPRIRNRAL